MRPPKSDQHSHDFPDKRFRAALQLLVFVCFLGRLEGFSTVPCAFKDARNKFQSQARRTKGPAVCMKDDHANKMVLVQIACAAGSVNHRQIGQWGSIFLSLDLASLLSHQYLDRIGGRCTKPLCP